MALLPENLEMSFTESDLPFVLPVTWREGRGTLIGTLTLYYCRSGEQGICLVERARIIVPIEAVQSGPNAVEILYVVDSGGP